MAGYLFFDCRRAVNRIMAEGVENKDKMYPQLEETTEKDLAIMNTAIEFLKSNLLTKEDKDRLQNIEDELNTVVKP